MSRNEAAPMPAAGQSLPAGLTAYKRTQVFDQDTLAPALLRDHQTKAGVWGMIHVVEGSLAFTVIEPYSECVLVPGLPAVVQPGQTHRVRLLGKVRFFIEFHRVEGAG